jgi:hypothetical protein
MICDEFMDLCWPKRPLKSHDSSYKRDKKQKYQATDDNQLHAFGLRIYRAAVSALGKHLDRTMNYAPTTPFTNQELENLDAKSCRLQIGRLRNQGSIPGKDNGFLSCLQHPHWLCNPASCGFLSKGQVASV